MAELCEKCGKRPATCVYTRRSGEKEQTTLLCAACAEAMGIGFGNLESFLFGDFGTLPYGFVRPVERKKKQIKKCDLCGATAYEILQSGKVGCPRCYATFAEELAPGLKKLHGGAVYKAEGKTESSPAQSAPADKENKEAQGGREEKIVALQKALAAAVAAEDYEKAATLRDGIKALKKEDGQNGMV